MGIPFGEREGISPGVHIRPRGWEVKLPVMQVRLFLLMQRPTVGKEIFLALPRIGIVWVHSGARTNGKEALGNIVIPCVSACLVV